MNEHRISEEIYRLARAAINSSVAANFHSGPSFLEHAYQECLAYESRMKRHSAGRITADQACTPVLAAGK